MNLVTGATGHIGNVLLRELLAQGEAVRALVLPGEEWTALEGLPVEIVEGDVLDYASLQAAMQGVEYVYHLAGVISILPGGSPLLKPINVVGTRNVVYAARQAGVRRLVYTSSIHALARPPHGVIIDETIPFDTLHAIGAYDYSKAAASQIVIEAARQGLDAVVVCPTGVIGPYDFRLSEVGKVIQGILQRKPQLLVDGAYDFVDVRDVAQGHILACKYGQPGESYILSGEQISLKQVVQVVQDFTGIRTLMVQVPLALARFAALFTPWVYRLTQKTPHLTSYVLDTVRSNSVISHAKAERELGYQPRRLVESLHDTVRWLRENSSLLRSLQKASH